MSLTYLTVSFFYLPPKKNCVNIYKYLIELLKYSNVIGEVTELTEKIPQLTCIHLKLTTCRDEQAATRAVFLVTARTRPIEYPAPDGEQPPHAILAKDQFCSEII